MGTAALQPSLFHGFQPAEFFLFPEGHLVAPDASLEGKEGLATPTPSCTGALPAELSLSDSPSPDPGSDLGPITVNRGFGN